MFCDDPVLDVRRSAAMTLLEIKRMLVLPMDHQLVKELESAASRLNEGSSNKAWKAFVSQHLKDLDAIHNPITWSLDTMFDDHELDQARQRDEEAVADDFEHEVAEFNSNGTGAGGGRATGNGLATDGARPQRYSFSTAAPVRGARDSLKDEPAAVSPSSRRRSLINAKAAMGGPESGALRGLLSPPVFRRAQASSASTASKRRGPSGSSPSQDAQGSRAAPTGASSTTSPLKAKRSGRRRIHTVTSDGPSTLRPLEPAGRAALHSKSMGNLSSTYDGAGTAKVELPRLRPDQEESASGTPQRRTSPRHGHVSGSNRLRRSGASNGSNTASSAGGGDVHHRRTSSAGSPQPMDAGDNIRSVSTTALQSSLGNLDLGSSGAARRTPLSLAASSGNSRLVTSETVYTLPSGTGRLAGATRSAAASMASGLPTRREGGSPRKRGPVQRRSSNGTIDSTVSFRHCSVLVPSLELIGVGGLLPEDR